MRLFLIFLIYLLSCCPPLAASPAGEPLPDEEGIASWYGGKFQGRRTANGEIFDTNQLTAAHKTLPFNTIVKVTSKNSGKSVEVRINDRGPFVPGRIIDLSQAGALAIDMIKTGVAPVKIEVITPGDGQTYHKTGWTETPADGGSAAVYTIQLGAFSNEQNASQFQEKLQGKGIKTETEKSGSIIRVVIASVEQEQLAAEEARLRAAGITGYLIRRAPQAGF